MKPNAWHLVIGLTLWFAWFCATYGGVAVACAWAPPSPAQGAWTWINAAVLLLAVSCTLAFVGAAWMSARGALYPKGSATQARQRFIAFAATALYVISAASTLLVALPAVVLPPCV
ncbi:hypothetical protein J2W49_002659 [Hydrogenophaga palleronii]|uniref:Uncharacterized protein n=1 Tax=Hydrogenophaga palleronii TaxID=65655 RepID=A0ABU1WN14_9BURK|nr:hypothetical protein [Hydrogenophaga palleronii]MDR7150696.1 hypothetical protein [Hydrogenophaga palleronii]